MKIPQNIIADVENETTGLAHGIVTLELHIRDFHLSRYTLNREKSVVTLQKAECLPPNSLSHKELKNVRPRNERRV